LDLTPQVCKEPALTAVKVVVCGASVWRRLLSPQHLTTPFRFRAHVCAPPAVTDVYDDLGGVACPLALSPQQTMSPSFLRAHV